jgi:hypothetical protein
MLLLRIRQEGVGDPIHVMKMVSCYISHLESQAARCQKAKNIEADLWKEWEDQLELMRGDAQKSKKLVAKGVAANVSRVHRDLGIKGAQA